MEIAGRYDERKILDWQHERLGSQFVAIYGRRRVGKTFLIRNHYAKYMVFQYSGLKDVSKKEQISNFYSELIRQTQTTALLPKSWKEAFFILSKQLDEVKLTKGRKMVVFLDEIPWMDSKRSGFMPAFTSFWNEYCDTKKNIILVICGSAATWIINKVVNNKAGLHNRITQTINLLPFDLSETKELLKKQKVRLSNKDIIQLYMCLGGIPYYLSHIQPGKSVPQIMDDLYFNKNAALKNEFDNLYRSLFDNYEDHMKIIGITGVAYNIYSFIDRGAQESTGSQIDLIIDRNDNIINLCEIKWRDGKYKMTKSDAESLRNKRASFQRKTKTSKSIFTTLITSNGSERNQYYLEMVATEITLDELG